jgi:tRNA threonylcarbamoyladenosine biosynthesis protein TsaE
LITKSVDINSLQDSLSLAQKIGAKLKGGEIIELVGDLGSGKTTFVSGIVLGAKSDDIVSSPSFVISKKYKTPKLEIYHFDFYRLDKSDLIGHELRDIVDQDNAVALIEWPGMIDSFINKNKMIIEFSYLEDINKRHLKIKYDKALGYLIN